MTARLNAAKFHWSESSNLRKHGATKGCCLTSSLLCFRMMLETAGRVAVCFLECSADVYGTGKCAAACGAAD